MDTKIFVLISEPTLLMVGEDNVQVQFSPYITQNEKMETITLGMATVTKDSPEHKLVRNLSHRFYYKETELPPTTVNDSKVLSSKDEDTLTVELGRKRNDNKRPVKQG